MQMLENSFILWGWDISFESNKARFQAAINRTLGSVAAMATRSIPVEKLPAIIIIMKVRSSTDIYSVIYGNINNIFLSCSLLKHIHF